MAALINRSHVNDALQLLAILVVDVLNPLLPIALALFASLGYLITLLGSVDVQGWLILLCGSALAPTPFLLVGARQRWLRRPTGSGSLDWRLILPLLPVLVFVPLFAAELDQPGLQIIYHGDLHVGYIHSILYRSTPVENIFLPGYPAQYYWLYHAFLAALIVLTGAAPPLVASVVNIVAILSSLLWLAQIIERLDIAVTPSLALGLVTIAVYCAVNATGVLNLLEPYFNGSLRADTLDIMLLGGGDRRLHSTMGKVMNFTSMTIAMSCFVIALYSATKIASGELTRMTLALAASACLVSLAFQPVVALFLFVTVFGGLLLTGWLVGFRDSRGGLRVGSLWFYTVERVGVRFISACAAVSLVLSLTLLHYVNSVTQSDATRIWVSQDLRHGVSMVVAATILFLPLFAAQTIFMFRRGAPPEYLIQIACILGILLTAIVALPDYNQYKFVFCLAMMLAMSSFLALTYLMKTGLRTVRVAAGCACALIFILTIARITFVKAYYDNRARQWSFAYDGSHINYYGDLIDVEALMWVRNETPTGAIVLASLGTHKYSHLIHERRIYLRKSQHWHTDGLPQYQVRLDRHDALYSEATTTDQYNEILSEMMAEFPDEEIYAVVSDEDVGLDTMTARGARRVFTHPNDGAHVYWLNP